MKKKERAFNFEVTMADGTKQIMVEKGKDMYEAFKKIQDKNPSVKAYILV